MELLATACGCQTKVTGATMVLPLPFRQTINIGCFNYIMDFSKTMEKVFCHLNKDWIKHQVFKIKSK